MTDPHPTDDLVESLMDEGARQRRAAAAARKAMPRLPKDRKVKRGSPEMDAQKAVVSWLRKAGCIVSRNINEVEAKERDLNKRARFWAVLQASGATKGFPDLTAVLPDGRVILIEMKAPKGVVSDIQHERLVELEQRGVIAVVGRDVWSVQAALQQRGVVISRQSARAAMPITGA